MKTQKQEKCAICHKEMLKGAQYLEVINGKEQFVGDCCIDEFYEEQAKKEQDFD